MADLGLLGQLTINGVLVAGIYALLGVSWALVFSVSRVFHIAHGVTFAAGGYAVVLSNQRMGLPLIGGLALSLLIGAAMGALFEVLLYRPLRARDTSRMVILVASMGALIVGVSVIILTIGTATFVPRLRGTPISVGGAFLSSLDLWGAVGGFGITALVLVMWGRGWLGRQFRAVSMNSTMAAMVGVRIERIRLLGMVIGGALGALAGGLYSMSYAVGREMVYNGALIAAIAVLVGGFGSLLGAALGAILLAMAMNIGIWQISSAWQLTIGFGLLLIIMVVRPRGLIGEPLEKADL